MWFLYVYDIYVLLWCVICMISSNFGFEIIWVVICKLWGLIVIFDYFWILCFLYVSFYKWNRKLLIYEIVLYDSWNFVKIIKEGKK